ncbi:hypothetical protein D3C73_1264530 [compost metagenome]
MLRRPGAYPVGHDPCRSQVGGELLPKQLDGPHGAFSAGYGEEAGLGYEDNAVACAPRHAR